MNLLRLRLVGRDADGRLDRLAPVAPATQRW
jgi:hypothetical protein